MGHDATVPSICLRLGFEQAEDGLSGQVAAQPHLRHRPLQVRHRARGGRKVAHRAGGVRLRGAGREVDARVGRRGAGDHAVDGDGADGVRARLRRPGKLGAHPEINQHAEGPFEYDVRKFFRIFITPTLTIRIHAIPSLKASSTYVIIKLDIS